MKKNTQKTIAIIVLSVVLTLGVLSYWAALGLPYAFSLAVFICISFIFGRLSK